MALLPRRPGQAQYWKSIVALMAAAVVVNPLARVVPALFKRLEPGKMNGRFLGQPSRVNREPYPVGTRADAPLDHGPKLQHRHLWSRVDSPGVSGVDFCSQPVQVRLGVLLGFVHFKPREPNHVLNDTLLKISSSA